MTRVQVLNNVEKKIGNKYICFQWCRYVHETEINYGYRFMWKDEDGNLLAHRGGAAIPSTKIISDLVGLAKKQGWANEKAM